MKRVGVGVVVDAGGLGIKEDWGKGSLDFSRQLKSQDDSRLLQVVHLALNKLQVAYRDTQDRR